MPPDGALRINPTYPPVLAHMSDFTSSSFAKGETPEFPLKSFGKVWHTGWDIPSYWAIDANDVPYADYGAHGCSLRKTTFDELITHMEDAGDGAAASVRELAGQKPKLPQWILSALSHGWTAPADFKLEDYDDGKRAPPVKRRR